MMLCDARWLEKVFGELSNEEISPVLNIGSSTKKFREIDQPHISQYVFKPLEERGIEIIHTDIKSAPGVDVTADIFDDESLKKLAGIKPKVIICTHMLEHVRDREELTKRLLKVLPEGGIFLITVPYSYHYHADPIDTMYRPSPEELASLFVGQKIIRKEVLIGDNYWKKIRQRPVTLFFRHFFRFFIPFLGVAKWKRSMRKLYWLFNPYKVSAIMGRKVSSV